MTNISRLESLFFKAMSNTDPVERQRFLEMQCNGDQELLKQVERLLERQDKVEGFLVHQDHFKMLESATVNHSPEVKMSSKIILGKYKLLEEIGIGGMGSVYVAEQTEPVKRKVAIKLIKPGMDSRTVLARFELERQALALMDHPNIAKVLDAGLTEENRPFFVMEYIKGQPLTKYCDETHLPLGDRLKLFVQICQAVQHAHQKGIIHRDLKPGNILIALYDGKPVPKVIDFGLAKALHMSLTEQTLHTAHELILGTPLYMSPEQAEQNNLDIDTRSDIYSLGVILYELLTGTTPLEQQCIKEAPWSELLRMIKEVEPSKPSTNVCKSASMPSIAPQRKLELQKFSKVLRGDLDWIVMKALAKERERRYETAHDLAADLQRYLNGQTVLAVPPTPGYRLKKFMKHHKSAVVTVVLIFAALTLGMIGTTYGMLNAYSAESEAKLQTALAQDERKKAVQSEKRAVENLERMTQVHTWLIENAFWTGLYLKNQQPDTALQSLLTQLDGESKWINSTESFLSPHLRYQVHISVAHAYRIFEKHSIALQHAEKSLALAQSTYGSISPHAAVALFELAQLNRLMNNSEEWSRYRKQGTHVIENLTDPIDEEMRKQQYRLLNFLREWVNEPDLSARLAQRLLTFALNQHGEAHPQVIDATHDLAWAKLRQGKIEEALKLEKSVVQSLFSAQGLSTIRRSQIIAEAQQLMMNAGKVDPSLLEAIYRILGSELPNLSFMAFYGKQLLESNEWEKAESVLIQCLNERRRVEPLIWTTFNTETMLGAALLGQKRYTDAEPYLLKGYEGLRIREKSIPPQGKQRLEEALDRLISLYKATEKYDQLQKWQAEKERMKAKSSK